MKFITNLFSRHGVTPPLPYVEEQTYTVGWKIFTKSGSIMSRTYDNVRNEELDEISEIVDAEINVMHAELNLAIAEKNEFVNLTGNIIRVSDFDKITSINVVNTRN